MGAVSEVPNPEHLLGPGRKRQGKGWCLSVTILPLQSFLIPRKTLATCVQSGWILVKKSILKSAVRPQSRGHRGKRAFCKEFSEHNKLSFQSQLWHILIGKFCLKTCQLEIRLCGGDKNSPALLLSTIHPISELVSWGELTLQGLCHPPGFSQEQWVKGRSSVFPPFFSR